MKKLTIDIEYLQTTLSELLAIPSPTGYTDDVVHYTCGQLKKLGLNYELTRRGAIRGTIKGKTESPDRAIVAHLDTLGAMVKNLKPNGRLSLSPLGSWSPRFAEGCRVKIISNNGLYSGTIIPLLASGHTYNDLIDTQPVSWENLELRIDEKVNSKEDLVHLGIDVGDFIAVDPQPHFSSNGFINSRHLDDKAGVAILLSAMKAIKESNIVLPVDCHPLFTISEEEGSGASSILHQDVAAMVAIDNATIAKHQNSHEFGVTICMKDSSGPYDYHLTKNLVELCKNNDISYSKDIFRFYKSDAASAIESGSDIRTALVCFALDSSHGYERTHLDSLVSVAQLLTLYMQEPVSYRREEKPLNDVGDFPHPNIKPFEQ